MKVLDLFSGIGAFSLGLERAGFETVAFCEIDPFARRVLAKHWPEVPCYDDVRSLTAARLAADGIRPDVICGGFPCQDISVAGRGAGIAGERSGLWQEFARLIGELRPSFVIVENVGALSVRGLVTVLGDLASCGFDAEWETVSASRVGAPHARERLWILAYSNGEGLAGFEQFRAGIRSFPGQTPTEFGNSLVSRGIQWTDLGPHLRMDDGPARPVDELRSLGNSIVPQIPELIGRAIAATASLRRAA